jgi:hypothetical protein
MGLSLSGLNQLRYEIVEVKMIPEKLYLWDDFCRMLNIKISDNSVIEMRNRILQTINNHAKRMFAPWRLKVKPTVGVTKITDANLVQYIVGDSLKKIRNANVTGEERVQAIAETIDLPLEQRKIAEKAAVLIGAGMDLLEHGINRSSLLKSVKQQLLE